MTPVPFAARCRAGSLTLRSARFYVKWAEGELNSRHQDFQSTSVPLLMRRKPNARRRHNREPPGLQVSALPLNRMQGKW